MVDVGNRVATERKRRGWSQARLAALLCEIAGHPTLTRHDVSRWERGERNPRYWLPHLARAFELDVAELETPVELLRRTFLQRSAAVATLPAIGLTRGQRIIDALDMVSGGQVSHVADGLGDIVEHYAMTVYARPPDEIYDELRAVRSYAGDVLGQVGAATPRRTDVMLSVGWLSSLLAVVAFDLGDHAAARVWCSDAERRGADARHPELTAWGILTRAMIAHYSGQARHSVALSARGRQVAPARSVIHAKLAAQEMRAAALLGDFHHMTHARRVAAKAITVLPDDVRTSGPFGIALAEDPPYTATSLLLAGRHAEAVLATGRVIDAVYEPRSRRRGDHPNGYARSMLILGLAQAGLGRLQESAAAGHAALAGSRPTWPTMVLAGQLDQVLSDAFAGAREAVDYRSRYLEAVSRLEDLG